MVVIKKYLTPLCLILAGCCVALLLAEGFIRVFYPYSRDHALPSGLFEIDDYLGWRLAVGKTAIHKSRYFEATYRINELGYRDKPRKLKKDSKTYRILLYGDSQVFGWGIPAEQRFSNLIENQFQQLEIWNLAVPGYGIDQEVLSYEQRGKLLNADEVFFFVSRSTLNRANYAYIFRKDKPKFIVKQNNGLELIPIQGAGNVWSALIYRVLSPFYLPYFVDRQLAILKHTTKINDDEFDQKSAVKSDVIGELQKRILGKARKLAHERKHKISIITDLLNVPGNDLEYFCEKMGMGFLQIPIQKEDPDYRFGRYDSHWNHGAHKLAAEQLLSILKVSISQGYENE